MTIANCDTHAFIMYVHTRERERAVSDLTVFQYSFTIIIIMIIILQFRGTTDLCDSLCHFHFLLLILVLLFIDLRRLHRIRCDVWLLFRRRFSLDVRRSGSVRLLLPVPVEEGAGLRVVEVLREQTTTDVCKVNNPLLQFYYCSYSIRITTCIFDAETVTGAWHRKHCRGSTCDSDGASSQQEAWCQASLISRSFYSPGQCSRSCKHIANSDRV